MRLIWSAKALSDLDRLHAFLEPSNRRAATQVIKTLRAGALKLREYPALGEHLPRVEVRDVRRVILGDYELRYEVRVDEILVLRLWHAREDR